jgi:hypothetical protein
MRKNNLNGKKMLSCFNHISAEILLRDLGYSFCTEHHILVHFCQMLLKLKLSKFNCVKAALLWGQKIQLNRPQ